MRKLPDDLIKQVKEALLAQKSNGTQLIIARKFNITQGLVSRIKTGKRLYEEKNLDK